MPFSDFLAESAAMSADCAGGCARIVGGLMIFAIAVALLTVLLGG